MTLRRPAFGVLKTRGVPAVAALALLVSRGARAGDIADLSLEALLDAPVTAASGTAIPVREAPGLIVRVDRNDILRSGARDLQDVLRFVPSIAPALDVLASTSLGVRGLWASEGKILVLIDGTPISERLYGSVSIGERIPAEIIDHVDILRGPGGVVHGRYAQLAVIDVVTVGAGVPGSSVASMRTGVAGMGIDDVGLVGGGVTATKHGSIGTSVWVGSTHPYDGAYTDVEGTISDVGHERLERARASVIVDQGRLHANVSAERYLMFQDTGYGYTLPELLPVEFDEVAADVSADLPVGKATVTPRLVAYWQAPWRVDSVPASDPNFYRGDVLVGAPRIDVMVPLGDRVDWTIGGEGSVTHVIANPKNPVDYTTFANGKPQVTYATGGAFTQVVGRWPVATVAGGFRVDAQTGSGVAFVPRIAVTRTFGETAHIKALVAQAFRPPDVQNFAFADGDLQPELTSTAEIEFGVRPVRHTYLTASVFDQRIARPIIYHVTFDPELGPLEGYTNGDTVSTYGADASFRWQPKSIAWNTSFAWYQIPGTPLGTANLGLPSVRAFSSASFSPTNHLWLTPAATVTSATPAVTGFADDGTSIIEDQPAAVQLDFIARLEDLNAMGLCIDFGVQDLLDAHPALVQAYDSGHLPVPNEGRSVFVRVTVTP